MGDPASELRPEPPRRPFPIYPPLIAVFPVLVLYGANVALVPVAELWEPLAFVAAAASAMWLLFGLILQDSHRGAAISSSVALAILLYGHVANLVERSYDAPLVAGWCLLTLLVVLAATTARAHVERLTPALNVVAVAAIAISGTTSLYSVVVSHFRALPRSLRSENPISVESDLPDIFYIILDGYGRSDQLKRVMAFDNKPFIDSLRRRGFYVADQSHSNYAQTELSISSSLNEDFLTTLLPKMERTSSDRGILDRMVDQNRVAQRLRSIGYKYVAVTSGFPAFEMTSADATIDRTSRLSLFEAAIINETPIGRGSSVGSTFFAQRRAELSGAFRSLEALALPTANPKFVFAHILAPHPPFVFGPGGESRQPDMVFGLMDGSHFMRAGGTPTVYRSGYSEQVQWLDAQVLKFLDVLLKQPGPRPIVLIQGDHGSKLRLDQESLEDTDIDECMSNLSAFLVPNDVRAQLYPTITPVNSFRIVLADLFGEKPTLLPDRSYYSTWSRPFAFEEVTARLQHGVAPRR